MASFIRYLVIVASWVAFLSFSHGEKFATWTFDRRNGTTIIPEEPSSRNFYADASSLGTNASVIFPPGKKGDCLFVDGKELILAKNLKHSCILDLDLCEFGLTITFYLKVVSWNNASAPLIFGTSKNVNSTGLYFGKSDDSKKHMLTFNMVGSSGKKTSRGFMVFLNSWVRFTYTVFQQSHSPFDERIPLSATEAAAESLPQFVIGSENGPTFYIDELSVDYSTSTLQNVVTMPVSTTQVRQTSHAGASSVYFVSVSNNDNVTNSNSPQQSPAFTTDINEVRSTILLTTAKSFADDRFNIFIPIIFGISICAAAICILIILCRRHRQRKRRANFNDPNEISMELAGARHISYVRASTTEPYHDLNSIAETDDDNTDHEVP